MDELLLAHGRALVSLGAAEVVHLLPASTTSKRAVEMAEVASGAQSSGSRRDCSQPSNVRYKDILVCTLTFLAKSDLWDAPINRAMRPYIRECENISLSWK